MSICIVKYKPDGINLDYIRYPQSLSANYSNYDQSNWGYTEYARSEFKSIYGVDPIELTNKTCDSGGCTSDGTAWASITSIPQTYGLNSIQVGNDSSGRQQVLNALGYKVFYVWEMDWKKGSKGKFWKPGELV